MVDREDAKLKWGEVMRYNRGRKAHSCNNTRGVSRDMHKYSYIDTFEYEGDEYKYVPRAKHKDILYTDPDGCASRKSTGWKAHKARHQWEHSVTNHTKGTPYIEERKSRKKRRQNLAVAK